MRLGKFVSHNGKIGEACADELNRPYMLFEDCKFPLNYDLNYVKEWLEDIIKK